jgi:hypothetical protein
LTEKQLITEVISNYEELKRILRKTEYEIHIGELKSKLNNLYFKKIILESLGRIPSPLLVLSIPFSPSTDFFNREIDALKKDLENAEITVRVSEEIQDRVISIFKIYLKDETERDILNEITQINKLISENILQTLEKSIDYKLSLIENRIKKGRFYFAQMKDSEKEYDRISKELKSNQRESDLTLRKTKLESLFDQTLNVIYDADLSIKDSKWFRIITYVTLLIAIVGIIIALIHFI